MDYYDLVRQKFERAKAEQEAERNRQAELEKQRSPAEKLFSKTEEELRREAKESKQEHTKEPEKEPPAKVAERMEYQPAGLQRPPSPGGIGITYTNPRAWRPAAEAAPTKSAEPERKQVREALIDQVNRELREQYKASEREEQQRKQQQERKRDDSRSL